MGLMMQGFLESNGTNRLFTGRNALRVALFYAENDRLPVDSELSDNRNLLEISSACYWREGNKPFLIMDEEVCTDYVHAKIYCLYNGKTIFSSQNNGNSVLFEFAILYDDPDVYNWASEQIQIAKNFGPYDNLVGFGKYADKTWKWIIDNDPDYIFYVFNHYPHFKSKFPPGILRRLSGTKK